MSVRELLGHLAVIQETLLLYQGERGRLRRRTQNVRQRPHHPGVQCPEPGSNRRASAAAGCHVTDVDPAVPPVAHRPGFVKIKARVVDLPLKICESAMHPPGFDDLPQAAIPQAAGSTLQVHREDEYALWPHAGRRSGQHGPRPAPPRGSPGLEQLHQPGLKASGRLDDPGQHQLPEHGVAARSLLQPQHPVGAVGIANALGRFGFGQLASPPGRIRGQPDVDDYKIPAGRAVAIT